MNKEYELTEWFDANKNLSKTVFIKCNGLLIMFFTAIGMVNLGIVHLLLLKMLFLNLDRRIDE